MKTNAKAIQNALHSNASFILTTESIGESDIIIEVVKAINYDLFSKLKVKYEQKWFHNVENNKRKRRHCQ